MGRQTNLEKKGIEKRDTTIISNDYGYGSEFDITSDCYRYVLISTGGKTTGARTLPSNKFLKTFYSNEKQLLDVANANRLMHVITFGNWMSDIGNLFHADPIEAITSFRVYPFNINSKIN